VRAVVQRVRGCSVAVSGRPTSVIEQGLLVYLGVGRGDTEKEVRAMADKIVNLRIFDDEAGKMNRSVRDVRGGLMIVSQFTLYGDAREGRRPSYVGAEEPQKARPLYDLAVRLFAESGLPVATGEFQAIMEVTYTNLGPVTILLDSEKKF
jgi:D-aminoacyl-tRNA deacylase